jgi:hypothetical protein
MVRKMKQRITQEKSGLTREEWAKLKSLKTPHRLQDFINSLKFDFTLGEEMDRSVRGTLKNGKTDCMGGAVFAAAALWVQGRAPILLDLKTSKGDFDHVLALFKEGKYFGAISKTNHGVLRYREPIYTSVRELAMSYFHEYFLPDGRKTMRSFSKPFDLSKQGTKWLTDPESLLDIAELLDDSEHTPVASKGQIKAFRKADKVEIKAGEITEYP